GGFDHGGGRAEGPRGADGGRQAGRAQSFLTAHLRSVVVGPPPADRRPPHPRRPAWQRRARRPAPLSALMTRASASVRTRWSSQMRTWTGSVAPSLLLPTGIARY